MFELFWTDNHDYFADELETFAKTIQAATPCLPAPLSRLIKDYVGYDPRMFSKKPVVSAPAKVENPSLFSKIARAFGF